jgi:hypothetical protein
MLNIEDCRKVFADQLQKTIDQKQSFERALMSVCEFAYQRGLEDCAGDSIPNKELVKI